jgi:hypothetical protein
MRPTKLLFLGSFVMFGVVSGFSQTAGDGSDLFLSAYSNFQKAESLEKSGDAAGALALYEEVSKAIAQLLNQYPGWNPQVVNLRANYTAEKIKRLRDAGVSSAPPAEGGGCGADGIDSTALRGCSGAESGSHSASRARGSSGASE